MAMPTPTEIDESIAGAIAAPKRASGDAGSVEQHSLDEQIRAAKYIATQDVAADPRLALHPIKLVPPGAI